MRTKGKGGFSVAAVVYPRVCPGLAFDLGANSGSSVLLIALGAALGVRRNCKVPESVRSMENTWRRDKASLGDVQLSLCSEGSTLG